jgi:NADPH:quinone reductase-like Zn-dependent oxidoreductase
MQAAVYSKNSTNGVRLATVPRPTLASTVYEPTSTSITRFWLFQIIKLISTCIGYFMRLLRWLIPSMPDSYGELVGRQWVLCRVYCGGVNPVDAKFLYGDKLPHFCLPLVKWFVEDRICGIDFSGIVMEAPPGCGYTAGDAVFGTIPPFCGSFAEYVRAPTDFISHKPNNMSFAEACALPLVGLTALQAFEDNNLMAGQHVLVLGASGGTGHFAVQIAKIKGARVTAVAGSRNVDFVKGLGADEILVYDRSPDILEDLRTTTSLHGPFDLVFDSVSSHDPRDANFAYETRIRNAKPKLITGMYIFIGGLVTDWALAHIKRFFGIDWFTKGRQLFWVRFPDSAKRLESLRQFCEANQLKVTIANRMPFTEEGIQEAFHLQMSRRTVGKIVIEVVSGQ